VTALLDLRPNVRHTRTMVEGGDGARLGRGAGFGIAAVGLEKAVALGIALYLPRHLGLPDYGRYAFLVSYLSFFQVLPDAGLEAVLVARLARAGAAAANVAGGGALVRLAVSVVGATVGLAVLRVATGDGDLVHAGAVAAVGFAATAGTPYRVLVRGRLRLGQYVTLIGAQATLAIAFLGLAIARGGGLVAVFGAVSTAALIAVILGRLLVGRGVRLHVDTDLARGLVREGWPLVGTTLALLGAQQVLQLLLLRLDGAAAVGLLGGAQKLMDAVGLLPQAVMIVILPALALAASRPEGAARSARDAARALVIVLVPPAAILALWAETILASVLGAPFAAAATVLRILAPMALLGATGAVITNLLIAVGQQRVLVRVTAVAAVAIVALGAALVPAYGPAAVATALLVATAAGQIALVLLPATGAAVGLVLAGVVRPIVLGIFASAAVLATGASLAPGVALLLAAYGAGLIATGTVTRADLARWA